MREAGTFYNSADESFCNPILIVFINATKWNGLVVFLDVDNKFFCPENTIVCSVRFDGDIERSCLFLYTVLARESMFGIVGCLEFREDFARDAINVNSETCHFSWVIAARDCHWSIWLRTDDLVCVYEVAWNVDKIMMVPLERRNFVALPSLHDMHTGKSSGLIVPNFCGSMPAFACCLMEAKLGWPCFSWI